MENLISELIASGYLQTPSIIDAFKKVRREDFVSDSLKPSASINAPLPIGRGQTISQPLTVAFMLEKLQPEKGNKILDIGSGSGWQTAMLCEIVGSEGQVFAVERIEDLKEFGQKNVAKYGYKNVEFFWKDASKGLSERAPFDRIIAAASAREIPEAWKSQLNLSGRIVTPVGNSIFLLIKKKEDFETIEYPGFVFVPLLRGEE